jgi:ABC-type Co2+ transport system permease subunit
VRSRRLLLITIGLALVVLALIGWLVQALRLPGRGLGALNTHLQSNRN